MTQLNEPIQLIDHAHSLCIAAVPLISPTLLFTVFIKRPLICRVSQDSVGPGVLVARAGMIAALAVYLVQRGGCGDPVGWSVPVVGFVLVTFWHSCVWLMAARSCGSMARSPSTWVRLPNAPRDIAGRGPKARAIVPASLGSAWLSCATASSRSLRNWLSWFRMLSRTCCPLSTVGLRPTGAGRLPVALRFPRCSASRCRPVASQRGCQGRAGAVHRVGRRRGRASGTSTWPSRGSPAAVRPAAPDSPRAGRACRMRWRSPRLLVPRRR